MLLYFGGEVQEMRSVYGDGGKGGQNMPAVNADMQLGLGSVTSGPTFRPAGSDAPGNSNPFAQPV